MSNPDDLTGVHSLHSAQQAESEWLLARERDPAAPAPSPELAAEYSELEDLLGSLPSGPSDKRWQADVLRAASALALPSRRWWRTRAFRWVMGGAMATAAALAVWLRHPEPPALEIAVRHTGTKRGAPDEPAIDDHLVVTARPGDTGELRVYRSGRTLVARCPNGPGCKGGSRGEQTLEITLDAPVQYQVILVDGVSMAPSDEAMDANAYLEAARAANAHSIVYRTIDVR
jgi:hypothetical protein